MNKRMKRFWRLLILGLLGAAVMQELSKEEKERQWNGLVFEVVPYDLRPPTVERFASRFWAPADDRLFLPAAFGVGWTINFARLFQMLREGSVEKL